LGGHLPVQRLGRWRSLWIGMTGISLSALLLLAGRNPVITIGASFLMGLVGALILIIVPVALSERHGEMQAVALSEANVIASLLSTAAPLMVGWFAHFLGEWRFALGLMALAPLLMFVSLGKNSALSSVAPTPIAPTQTGQLLPRSFWMYWAAIVLAVSVEFCMIFWSADYLEHALGLVKADAAQAVSFFLAAMIAGRLIGSRLVRRFTRRAVVFSSVLVAGAGFLIFWTAGSRFSGLSGLFISGLGVANLYPLLLSQAISAADGKTVQAGARATLASGTAILALPLALGRLADAVGIRPAYGLVILLLAGVFLIGQLARRISLANQPVI
jgi:fucose permease